MAPQLYLITPVTAEPERLAETLMALLNAAEFSALLLPRGTMDAASYAELAATAITIGQTAGCAVLVEDDFALAKRLGADGVHVTGGPAALKAAIAALKPALIVGAGNLQSRHDAMTAGELDIDYVFFGSTTGASDPAVNELAAWWAQTFEIPAVLSQPDAGPDTADAHGAEFLALSDSVWSAPAPAAAIHAIAARLGVTS